MNESVLEYIGENPDFIIHKPEKGKLFYNPLYRVCLELEEVGKIYRHNETEGFIRWRLVMMESQ